MVCPKNYILETFTVREKPWLPWKYITIKGIKYNHDDLDVTSMAEDTWFKFVNLTVEQNIVKNTDFHNSLLQTLFPI